MTQLQSNRNMKEIITKMKKIMIVKIKCKRKVKVTKTILYRK